MKKTRNATKGCPSGAINGAARELVSVQREIPGAQTIAQKKKLGDRLRRAFVTLLRVPITCLAPPVKTLLLVLRKAPIYAMIGAISTMRTAVWIYDYFEKHPYLLANLAYARGKAGKRWANSNAQNARIPPFWNGSYGRATVEGVRL